MREAHGAVAYGFIPFRAVDPAENALTTHGVDERAVADLPLQVEAALHIGREIGRSG